MMKSFSIAARFFRLTCFILLPGSFVNAQSSSQSQTRQRISINEGWRFFKYNSLADADNLIYDVRPAITDATENKVADAKPTEAIKTEATREVLKPWILPTGNRFIKDPSNRHVRPSGNPGSDFQFVKNDFDDSAWEQINLPHDWAIKGPFMAGNNPEVGGGMGRLPSNGVAWYRKKLDISASDKGKSIFLDVDGAMSYAIVWLNGNLVGGWPYGYNSWRVDLSPYVVPGGVNQLVMRIDNPNNSSRWYPGGGIYRNVWLIKTDPIHVSQWGTFITTKNISKESATVDLRITIDNDTKNAAEISAVTRVYSVDAKGNATAKEIVNPLTLNANIVAGSSVKISGELFIKNPKLWGPPPTQLPNLYVAVTTLFKNNKPIDTYKTTFGIRSLGFNPDKGILINGEHISIKGVNQHHDVGSLGAAFNIRAAERQLEMLREIGCNAIRMAHNPPAPELLALTDRMGFLVIDEIFDSWERKKTPHDFHLIFPEWSEPDARTFVQRDRNSPSIIIWSFGNEVGEQYTGDAGAAVAKRLRDIVKEEDPTRPTTSAMNYAKPDMPLPGVLDIICLNYQGEGIRQSPEFEGTERIRTKPQYDAFHEKFPGKVILSSETASAFSSRGVYLFPVTKERSAPVRDGKGGDSRSHQVSSYELYAVDFGASADKVFGAIDSHPFVAGEFVWTGWDHLGEPTPYYEARSAYCGIIDLAGFKKDRFFLYQSRWRPDLAMVHILPHWTWPERVGEITPVHVFTSGDEVELFLNGVSLGRKKKGLYEYRLRWDSVAYNPGELKAIAYKRGVKWAQEIVTTAGVATQLEASVDHATIAADGNDLAFVVVRVTDDKGVTVPRANNSITFKIEGPGEIVATDNGDPTNLVAFPSLVRDAFNGYCLAIVKGVKGKPGTINVTAEADNLRKATLSIKTTNK